MRPRILPLALFLLAAAPASSAVPYVIYLKGGGQITARQEPTVRGGTVFYTSLTGAIHMLKLADYDEKRTREANAQGTGDAVVLADPPRPDDPVAPRGTPTGPKPPRRPTPAADPGPTGGEGRKDASPEPVLEPQVESTFLHTLETYGVRTPRVTAGSVGVRVQGTAETEDQVFSALRGIARSLYDTRATPRPVPKADIWLFTSGGESAGHFEMSLEDADQLVGGQKSAAEWFMSNVIL